MRIFCAFRENMIQVCGAIFAKQNLHIAPNRYYERLLGRES